MEPWANAATKWYGKKRFADRQTDNQMKEVGRH